MHWERKICFRLTPRRIVGAILAATTVMNLVIVGVAFEVGSAPITPTLPATWTVPSVTITLFSTSPPGSGTITLTTTSTIMLTQTSSPTPTFTFTATDTKTVLPSSTPCVPYYAWPIYIVQPGDALSTLAGLIGSSPEELRLANCLSNDLIYAGQLLYVPRLPIKTAAPTLTPSSTSIDIKTASPTVTLPTTPTGTPPTPTATPATTPTYVTPTATDTPYLLFQQ